MFVQCRGGDGVCADEVYGGASCSNDITAIDGYVEDAQQCVTFSRPINATGLHVCVCVYHDRRQKH